MKILKYETFSSSLEFERWQIEKMNACVLNITSISPLMMGMNMKPDFSPSGDKDRYDADAKVGVFVVYWEQF